MTRRGEGSHRKPDVEKAEVGEEAKAEDVATGKAVIQAAAVA